MTYITIRFQQEGWHRWPQATGKRKYLANVHRHLFHVMCQVDVLHSEREIELHDFADFCKLTFSSLVCKTPNDLKHPAMEWSCETLAQRVVDAVTTMWPQRYVLCEVSEDGECSATYATFDPHTVTGVYGVSE